jgi:ABC-type microcin C transport system permease subunit YejB
LCSTAQHLALPVITLVVLSTAVYSRYMRASMLEVLNSDYVRTARAKGLIERRVIMRHAFRNALIPLVTVVALGFGDLFAGAIVTETIFTVEDGFLLHQLTVRERSVPRDGLAHGRSRRGDHVQPDRRHPVHRFRSSHSLPVTGS